MGVMSWRLSSSEPVAPPEESDCWQSIRCERKAGMGGDLSFRFVHELRNSQTFNLS